MKKTMTQLIKKEHMRNSILLVIAAGIVLMVSLWGMNEHLSITILGDEFGYWQGAAFFSGKDWSEVGATNGYFSYGYGLLLAPIMLIWGSDSVAMFHAALILNAILLSSCVYAAYLLIGYLADNIKGLVRVIIAIMVVLYPSNVVYSATTLSEILLTALVWWYLVLAIHYIEKQKVIQAIGLTVMSAYMYAVHHRCVTVIVVTVLLIGWTYRKMLLSRKMIVLVAILFFSFLIFRGIKSEYISSFWNGNTLGEGKTLGNNNPLGELDKVKRILTSGEGFRDAIYSFVGKIYYISVATTGLVILGTLYSIKVLMQKKREEISNDNKMLAIMVIFLLFFFAFAIDVVSVSSAFSGRADLLIYGRYMEYTIGPMIVLGIIYLFNMLDFKEILASLTFVAGTTIMTAMVFPQGAPTSHLYWTCTAVAKLFPKSYVSNLDAGVSMAFLRGSLLLGVILIAFKLRDYFRNAGIIIAFICVAATWVSIGSAIREHEFLVWSNKVYTQHERILNIIGEEEFGIYDAYMGAFFQFQRVDAKVHVYSSMEQIEALDGDTYIITSNSSQAVSDIQRNYEVIYAEGYNFLWKKQ